jgi:hypothetical protein
MRSREFSEMSTLTSASINEQKFLFVYQKIMKRKENSDKPMLADQELPMRALKQHRLKLYPK